VQKTVDEMQRLGVFEQPIRRVSEIGPGSGRYLAATKERCNPEYYEIYETAAEWRDWLVHTYGVIAQPTDGYSLRPSTDDSIDLTQCHKVLCGLSVLTAFGYVAEMARITHREGHVVFDVVTERCASSSGDLAAWLATKPDWLITILPWVTVVEFCRSVSLSLCGSFIVPMLPGRTEVFVFLKR
jgi:hypothetical protein